MFIDEKISTKWLNKWRRETKPSKIKWMTERQKKLTNSYRKEDVMITQLRIGHTRSTHSYFMNK